MRIATVRMNANTDDVTLFGKNGDSHKFERADFDGTQRSTFREMVVNHWCRMNNQPELYAQ